MSAHRLSREMCRSFVAQQLFAPARTSITNVFPGAVGIELETIPYRPNPHDDSRGELVQLFGGDASLTDVLLAVAAPYGCVAQHWIPGASLPGYSPQIESIAFPDDSRFLFEPGGQVEISTAPQTSIEALRQQLADRQAILDAVTQHSNIRFAQIGFVPWWKADELTNQLHKPRYRALEAYLNRIGPYGKRMMLQTCSLHVNLDAGVTPEIRARRIIAANLLVPFATALFAHSAISDGRVNGHKSYRSFIWQHLDATRTGILPLERLSDNFSEAELIDLYLDFLLKAPVVYIPESGEKPPPPHMTFEYWMQQPLDGLLPDITHLANHATLLFPELRLKGYLEIRTVDTPPRQWQLIPLLFYTGLLYNDAHLDEAINMLLPFKKDIKALHSAAMWGLESETIFSIGKKLMRLAIDGFSGLPETFTDEYHRQQLSLFFERFTARRKTFADEQLEAFQKEHAGK